MTATKETSMFGTVEQLCKEVKEHDGVLDEHTRKIDDNTTQLKIQAEQIKQLQDNGLRLENVIMNENRETRMTVTQSNNQLHELINGIMGFKSGQSQLTTNLKMAYVESVVKIVSFLGGAGGILYYVFGGK